MFRNHVFHNFYKNSTSKQKKNYGKQETSAKFQQKIFNSMAVGAHQSFQILRKNTRFL